MQQRRHKALRRRLPVGGLKAVPCARAHARARASVCVSVCRRQAVRQAGRPSAPRRALDLVLATTLHATHLRPTMRGCCAATTRAPVGAGLQLKRLCR
jgi:hypothetical protein